jgi:hypothetical protein
VRWYGLAALAAVALTLRAAVAAPPPAQQAYLKASNTGSNEWLGFSVAISGNTLVVGAPYLDSSAPPPPSSAPTKPLEVVGVPYQDKTAPAVNVIQSGDFAGTSGAAYVFVRSGTNWSQQAYLKAFNTGTNDRFGFSVAVSGDTVVVGAHHESSNANGVNGNQTNCCAYHSGAAYVFARSGTNWSQQAYLKASNTGVSDFFGWSVAASGDTVVVGAYGESSNASGVNGNQSDNSAAFSGAAYVFVRTGTNWNQQAYLKASNTGVGDTFGWSVAMSGDTVVVGANGESSNATGVNGNQSNRNARCSGAAYVFVRTGTNWNQQAYLKASNSGGGFPGDWFGNSVAVSGNTVVVGAPNEESSATGVNGNQIDNSATDSGAAYVFVRSGTNWSQQAYLKASNTGVSDFFGESVSVSADTVVVGATGEASIATGVNGNQSDNSTVYAGAAYVFVRNGTTWNQQSYLKASNTGVEDVFGISVALSGERLVVGAFREDSNATGVNGNQSDDSATDSGAAYVFTALGIGPTLAFAPDGTGGYFIRFAGHAGFAYRLERDTSLTGSWPTIATTNAPASGLVELHDPSPLTGQAFYRAASP